MKVYEALADPKKWTRGTLARRADGSASSWHSDDATCFCVLGAIYKLSMGDATEYLPRLDKVRNVLAKRGLPIGIGDFNDDPSTTHKLVLEVLKEADV